ncbi:MAG: hypothetical protein RR909_04335 [Bacilli bacterium]
MDDNQILNKKVNDKYLKYRNQILECTNDDMNLILDNEKQVYIAMFDIPLKSNILGYQTQSLALVFGLNTHVYHGSGNVMTELEKNSNVKNAMQSLLISSSQVIPYLELTDDVEFYNSDYIRVYLKTAKGIYFKELNKETKENDFIKMLMNNVLKEIAKTGNLYNS